MGACLTASSASEVVGGSRGEGGTEVEVDAAESELIDDVEGRCLRKAGFSLKRIVLRRKLEAPLDLRLEGMLR